MKLHSLLKFIVTQLSKNKSIKNPEQESWWLLEELFDVSRVNLISQNHRVLTFKEQSTLHNWLEQRIRGVPLAYVLGVLPFGSLNLAIVPPVFIPRPETEEWVYNLIKKLAPIRAYSLDILEICTGSGALSLALACALPNSRITGIEKSYTALRCAQKNAQRLGITNVSFLRGDFFSLHFLKKEEKYDLVVSNPPYLSEREWYNLDVSVKDWEDKHAFVAQENGFAFYTKIAQEAQRLCKVHSPITKIGAPRLVVECADHQAEIIINIFKKFSLSKCQYYYDFAGKKRVITATF